jgi:hypothetical protein
MKINNTFIFPLLLVLILFACSEANTSKISSKVTTEIVEKDTALMAYGLDISKFELKEGTVKPNEFLSDILLQYDVPYQDIDALARNTRDTFDVRKIRAGDDFLILSGKDSIGSPEYFIYEDGHTDYVVFCLKDSLYAYCGKKPVEIIQKET